MKQQNKISLCNLLPIRLSQNRRTFGRAIKFDPNVPQDTLMTKNRLPQLKSIKKLMKNYTSQKQKQQMSQYTTIFQNLTKNKDNKTVQIMFILKEFHQTGENMVENVYNYQQVQKQIKKVNQLAEKLREDCITFKALAFSALILLQYSSFSLSLYYIDKALKKLNMKQTIFQFQKTVQLKLYKAASEIILLKGGNFQQAKDLGYKYLRKTWAYSRKEAQLQAYDFLGRIYLQKQESNLTKYFHNRMCCGIHQKKEWVNMSNTQLKKSLIDNSQYFGGQNLSSFTHDDKQFNKFLELYYISQAQQEYQTERYGKKRKYENFLYTHRSQNRVIKNRHQLQRNMRKDRNSLEMHFVNEKQANKIMLAITEFSRFMNNVEKKFRKKHQYSRLQI